MFDENGLLPAGLHVCDHDVFQQEFIDQFSSSQTRKSLFVVFNKMLKDIELLFQPYEIWLDGSFTTSKTNPNDIDLVMFLELSDFLSHYNSNEFMSLRAQYAGKLDIYLALAVNDQTKASVEPEVVVVHTNQRNYWRGQFGFDRQDRPKGFIVFEKVIIKNFCVGGS